VRTQRINSLDSSLNKKATGRHFRLQQNIKKSAQKNTMPILFSSSFCLLNINHATASGLKTKFKMNITDKVWQKLIFATSRLEVSLKKISPSSRITKIIVENCSFTKNLMVEGSDLDSMYIGIEGIDNPKILDSLNTKFSSWIKIDGLNIKGGNSLPRITPNSLLVEKEKILLSAEKNLITVYETGKFKSREDILKENRFPEVQVDKYLARLKLLLLMDEFSKESANLMLKKIDPCLPFYGEFKSMVENCESLKLNEAAIQLVTLLHKLLDEPIKIHEVSKDEEIDFEEILFELCRKNLVRIYNGKVIPIWMVHGTRWSDKFWQDQIIIKGEGNNVDAGLKLVSRVSKRLENISGNVESQEKKPP
jgi:hypothetical protein